jgi:hypothetical protein
MPESAGPTRSRYSDADERRPAFHDIRDDFDDDFGRVRTPREVARRLVLVPAIAILVIGLLGIVGMCVAEAFLLYENLDRAMNGRSFALQNLALGSFGIMLAVVLFSIAIAGGMSMMNLRRRWLALFAAYIVAGLSLGGCYGILFYPFGIWGLIVLYRPDVRREFQRLPRKVRDDD